jgi:hypothetical protein
MNWYARNLNSPIGSSIKHLIHAHQVLFTKYYYGDKLMIRWVGHVIRTGEIKNGHKILVGKLERNDYLGVVGVGESIILKWRLGN